MASLANLFVSRDRVFYELFAQFAADGRRAPPSSSTRCSRTTRTHARSTSPRSSSCEHEGDTTLHEIRERLNQTFVTPIDREDILELGSALDDVIDFTEEAADYLVLYAIEAPMEQAQRLAADPARRDAPGLLRRCRSVRDFSDASALTHEIHRLENEGDRVSRDAIASLFRDGIDPMVVIRWKDIFERLEQAIDASERVADVIDEIIIKNAREHGRRPRPRDRRRDGARVRLHERLPRHRQRRRHVDRHARDVAALRRRARGDPELRRRVHLAEGRGDDRQRHRRVGRRHADGDLRRRWSARSPGTSSPGGSACRRARRTR